MFTIVWRMWYLTCSKHLLHLIHLPGGMAARVFKSVSSTPTMKSSSAWVENRNVFGLKRKSCLKFCHGSKPFWIFLVETKALRFFCAFCCDSEVGIKFWEFWSLPLVFMISIILLIQLDILSFSVFSITCLICLRCSCFLCFFCSTCVVLTLARVC